MSQDRVARYADICAGITEVRQLLFLLLPPGGAYQSLALVELSRAEDAAYRALAHDVDPEQCARLTGCPGPAGHLGECRPADHVLRLRR